MKKTTIGFVVSFLLLGIAGRVWGHVFPDHAEPRVGSTVSKSPAEVKIWFTGDVEPAFSRIQVLDADGKQVDRKDSHVDAKDKTLLIVSVPQLAAGTYKVVWEAVATDTHKTTGDFKFIVQLQG